MNLRIFLYACVHAKTILKIFCVLNLRNSGDVKKYPAFYEIYKLYGLITCEFFAIRHAKYLGRYVYMNLNTFKQIYFKISHSCS